jgi:hypothetical protein
MEISLEKKGLKIDDKCGIFMRQGYESKCINSKMRTRISELMSTTIVHGILVTAEKDLSLSK